MGAHTVCNPTFTALRTRRLRPQNVEPVSRATLAQLGRSSRSCVPAGSTHLTPVPCASTAAKSSHALLDPQMLPRSLVAPRLLLGTTASLDRLLPMDCLVPLVDSALVAVLHAPIAAPDLCAVAGHRRGSLSVGQGGTATAVPQSVMHAPLGSCALLMERRLFLGSSVLMAAHVLRARWPSQPCRRVPTASGVRTSPVVPLPRHVWCLRLHRRLGVTWTTTAIWMWLQSVARREA
jgi:hypothetical protein